MRAFLIAVLAFIVWATFAGIFLSKGMSACTSSMETCFTQLNR